MEEFFLFYIYIFDIINILINIIKRIKKSEKMIIFESYEIKIFIYIKN